MPVYTATSGDVRINILGVHIPKTGGTAVSRYLTELGFAEHFGTEHRAIRQVLRCPPQHYHYDILDQIFDIDRFNYSFAIVRDPIARIVSDYKWTTEKSSLRHQGRLDFDAWLDQMLETYQSNPMVLANHIRPQHHYVGPKLKAVFKYEDGLDVALTDLFERSGVRLGKPVEIPRVNESESRERPAIGAQSQERLAAFYARDFAEFGYPVDFGPWTE